MLAVLDRLRRLLPGLWAGWLLCVALLATPAPFATLLSGDAARVVARMLAQEAYTSLALGVLLLVLERLSARRGVALGAGSQFTTGMALALAAVFCTIAGYFAVQPLMPGARTGHGPLSFAQLHVVSVAFYLLKVGVVGVLAWRAASIKPAAPAS